MRGTVIQRNRVNQPGGLNTAGHSSYTPVRHYCVNHNYDYYAFSWIDQSTGTEYKQGYYDENGQYYEDVSFLTDGKYKNVLCQCAYCDTITKLDWSEGGPLICPQCGGTMKLLSALDEYTRDPNYERLRTSPDYVDYADRNLDRSLDRADSSDYAPIIRSICVVLFAIVLLIPKLSNLISTKEDDYGYDYPIGFVREDGGIYQGNGAWVWYDDPAGTEVLDNPARFGTELTLRKTGQNVYEIETGSGWDKVAHWVEDEQSYYDEDSGLWLWYNTDVSPNLWQYWYEPISEDFGDYGWMEYEDGTWYIETDAGNWIAVPDNYDTTPLWYIAGTDANIDPDANSHVSTPTSAEPLYLCEVSPNVYARSDETCYDTVLTANEFGDYKDPELPIWLNYNTNVTPNLWRYWYEPVSDTYGADGGDCGWMEYEDGTWYVEADAGDWIAVPDNLDTAPLWHILTRQETENALSADALRRNGANYAQFGDRLTLIETQRGVFRLVQDGASPVRPDSDEDLTPSDDDMLRKKSLLYVENCDCYWDTNEDLWLVYDTDSDADGGTGNWLYWSWDLYEKNQTYGWLDFRDGVWYVQRNAGAEAGAWIPLPERDQILRFWHIEK